MHESYIWIGLYIYVIELYDGTDKWVESPFQVEEFIKVDFVLMLNIFII